MYVKLEFKSISGNYFPQGWISEGRERSPDDHSAFRNKHVPLEDLEAPAGIPESITFVAMRQTKPRMGDDFPILSNPVVILVHELRRNGRKLRCFESVRVISRGIDFMELVQILSLRCEDILFCLGLLIFS
jgi:hypothetical protein